MEKFTVFLALLSIVFVSIVIGSLLPLILEYFKLDPAHASTTIQVVMDILGVIIICFIASFLLSNNKTNNIDAN